MLSGTMYEPVDLFPLLPIELVIEIALYLSFNEIITLSLSNHYLNNAICNNDYYWQRKYLQESTDSLIYLIHDHDESISSHYTKSFKELYKKYLLLANVWVFGYNAYGELCLGDHNNRNIPTQLTNFRAKKVFINDHHKVIIDYDNNIWTQGRNNYGQLCLNDFNDRKLLTRVEYFYEKNIKIKCVAIGLNHTILLDLNNDIWVCGSNEFGQLGLGNTLDKFTPTQIFGLQAQQVAAGEFHTVILDLNNNIWVCGKNNVGQLGVGDQIDRHYFTLLQTPGVMNALQIAAGKTQTVILDTNNNIWICGYSFGQLISVPVKLNKNFKFKYITSGSYNMMAIDSYDNIWICSDNFAQLGAGNYQNIKELIQIPNIKGKKCSIGGTHIGIIDLQDNLWVYGTNNVGQLGLDLCDSKRSSLIKIENFKIKEISMGPSHTIMIGIKIK